jgi:RHS repeat-associated protein
VRAGETLEYRNTAGKLAWADTAGVTTIAYGYDDAGRLERRDQWLAGLSSSQRFSVDSTYGGDGRVVSAGINNPWGGDGLTYAVTYDTAGRPTLVSGSFAGSSQTVFYEAADAGSGLGRFDALGRPRVLKADDGHAVSVQRYNPFTGNLSMECKRLGGSQACEGSQVDSSLDLYRTDAVGSTTTEAAYTGGLLKSYTDLTSNTSFGVNYYATGKVSRVVATPQGGASLLGQDFDETYTFDALGNVKTTSTDRVATVDAERSTSGDMLDRAERIVTSAVAGSTDSAKSKRYAYDTLNRLSSVTRFDGPADELELGGEIESLVYGPNDELVMRKVGEKYWFYIGRFATVTASGSPGCGTNCAPQWTTAVLDAHVIFGGTRIASAKASRTLYYYRSRLGTVVSTSLNGGRMGAQYRYKPYGVLEASTYRSGVAVEDQESELGYADALRLGGVEAQGQYAGRFKENLLHLTTRAYSPETKQFLQADSVDKQRYAYAAGDPINLNDPTGTEPITPGAVSTITIDGFRIPLSLLDFFGPYLGVCSGPVDCAFYTGMSRMDGQVNRRVQQIELRNYALKRAEAFKRLIHSLPPGSMLADVLARGAAESAARQAPVALGPIALTVASAGDYDSTRGGPQLAWVFGVGVGAGAVLIDGAEVYVYGAIDGHGNVGFVVAPAWRVGIAAGFDVGASYFYSEADSINDLTGPSFGLGVLIGEFGGAVSIAPASESIACVPPGSPPVTRDSFTVGGQVSYGRFSVGLGAGVYASLGYTFAAGGPPGFQNMPRTLP